MNTNLLNAVAATASRECHCREAELAAPPWIVVYLAIVAMVAIWLVLIFVTAWLRRKR